MNARTEVQIPRACVPGAIDCEVRGAHFQLIDQLFHQQLLEQTELDDGFAFRFDAENLETLGRFIANERKCCPFVSFVLSVAPGADSVWLHVTGPAGTKEVLQAELALRE